MSDPLLPDPSAGARRFRKSFLLALALGISVLFFFVIRRFLLTVLLAGVGLPLAGFLTLVAVGRVPSSWDGWRPPPAGP